MYLLILYVCPPFFALFSILGSQGDGIEFKKSFRRIKELLVDIICKPPTIPFSPHNHALKVQ